jgi:hypothetical protein
MSYGVPGLADSVSSDVLRAWNQMIEQMFADQAQNFGSRFMVLDPASITGGIETDAAKWPGSPAEPEFCRDVDVARKLADWGVRGRQALHNEYLEYHVTMRMDAEGKLRPKRVEITTELREYWLTLAVHDPDQMQSIAEEITGESLPFSEFYGPGVSDPNSLSPQQRATRFAMHLGGDGKGSGPLGRLNRDHALFMAHPINGLDDLIFIVMFGAIPRRVATPSGFRKAELHEVFVEAGTTFLACRHADPAAAAAAHDAASQGQVLAFADPLGMYIRSFSESNFLHAGNPVPAHWTRFSRGVANRFQRLEFGPPDDETFFLDEVKISTGNQELAITGGYDVVAQVEVGPILVAGPTSVVAPSEFREIPPAPQLDCRAADVCSRITVLEQEFVSQATSQAAFARSGPRQIGGM